MKEIHREDTVYNIHLDGDHTYFVTESEVLVHNYDVKKGDSLIGIAKKHGISVAVLKFMNKGKIKGDVIRIGQELRIVTTNELMSESIIMFSEGKISYTEFVNRSIAVLPSEKRKEFLENCERDETE